MTAQLPLIAVEATAPGCIHANPLASCPSCAALVAEMCAAFAEDVEAGRYDADGYTAAERRKRTTP